MNPRRGFRVSKSLNTHELQHTRLGGGAADAIRSVLSKHFIAQTGLETPKTILISFIIVHDAPFENAPKYLKPYFVVRPQYMRDGSLTANLQSQEPRIPPTNVLLEFNC